MRLSRLGALASLILSLTASCGKEKDGKNWRSVDDGAGDEAALPLDNPRQESAALDGQSADVPTITPIGGTCLGVCRRCNEIPEQARAMRCPSRADSWSCFDYDTGIKDFNGVRKDETSCHAILQCIADGNCSETQFWQFDEPGDEDPQGVGGIKINGKIARPRQAEFKYASFDLRTLPLPYAGRQKVSTGFTKMVNLFAGADNSVCNPDAGDPFSVHKFEHSCSALSAEPGWDFTDGNLMPPENDESVFYNRFNSNLNHCILTNAPSTERALVDSGLATAPIPAPDHESLRTGKRLRPYQVAQTNGAMPSRWSARFLTNQEVEAKAAALNACLMKFATVGAATGVALGGGALIPALALSDKMMTVLSVVGAGFDAGESFFGGCNIQLGSPAFSRTRMIGYYEAPHFDGANPNAKVPKGLKPEETVLHPYGKFATGPHDREIHYLPCQRTFQEKWTYRRSAVVRVYEWVRYDGRTPTAIPGPYMVTPAGNRYVGSESQGDWTRVRTPRGADVSDLPVEVVWGDPRLINDLDSVDTTADEACFCRQEMRDRANGNVAVLAQSEVGLECKSATDADGESHYVYQHESGLEAPIISGFVLTQDNGPPQTECLKCGSGPNPGSVGVTTTGIRNLDEYYGYECSALNTSVTASTIFTRTEDPTTQLEKHGWYTGLGIVTNEFDPDLDIPHRLYVQAVWQPFDEERRIINRCVFVAMTGPHPYQGVDYMDPNPWLYRDSTMHVAIASSGTVEDFAQTTVELQAPNYNDPLQSVGREIRGNGVCGYADPDDRATITLDNINVDTVIPIRKDL